MVCISCFYIHYNRHPINFTFIRFTNFIKVILNKRSIILTNERLASNIELFQIYKLSLLCTKDSSTIEKKQEYIINDKNVEIWYYDKKNLEINVF